MAVSSSEAERVSDPAESVGARVSLDDAVVAATEGGMPVVGTVRSLARAWGVSVSELRSTLRVLLEAERITVHLDAWRRLTIRGTNRHRAPHRGAVLGAERSDRPSHGSS
jgi:hypothetical protein